MSTIEGPITITDSKTAEGPGELRDALRSWEMLRILYNALMLGAGWIAVERVLGVGPRTSSLIYYGILFNLCYSVGPLAEAYSYVFLGHTWGKRRYAIFACGFVFSWFLVEMIAALVEFTMMD